MDKRQNIEARPGDAERPPESGAASPGRGGRMSRPRKTAAVLRLLRGEDLETVSRGLGVHGGDAERLARCISRRRRGSPGDEVSNGRGTGERSAESQTRCGADRARSAAREDRCAGVQPPFVATDVQAMSKANSPVTGKPYGLAAVCRAWRIARSGVYRHRTPSPPPRRRGPIGALPDAALTAAIQAVLPPARSMARAIARCGRGCATPAYGPHCAGCFG